VEEKALRRNSIADMYSGHSRRIAEFRSVVHASRSAGNRDLREARFLCSEDTAPVALTLTRLPLRDGPSACIAHCVVRHPG